MKSPTSKVPPKLPETFAEFEEIEFKHLLKALSELPPVSKLSAAAATRPK